MSDDLTNAQTEPVAPQTVESAPVTPEATPVAPEATPAAAPAEPFIADVSFLDDIGREAEPDHYQQPPPQYQQPPPQYYPPPPQYQQPPQQDWGRDVNSYIDLRAQKIAEDAVYQNLGPIAVQLRGFQEQARINMETSAGAELNRAKSNTASAVQKTVSSDRAYREDARVKGAVDQNIRNWLTVGYREAMATGNAGKLQATSDPGFFKVLLEATKARVGYQPNPAGPAVPSGAVLETQSPAVAQPVVELPPDMQEVATLMGDGFAERLRREYAVTKKAGDYEDYES